MPYYVNGQLVPEEIIQQEAQRIAADVTLQSIADPVEICLCILCTEKNGRPPDMV